LSYLDFVHHKDKVEIETNHEKTNRQNIAHQETSGTLCQKTSIGGDHAKSLKYKVAR
jgi:hypothetical protein